MGRVFPVAGATQIPVNQILQPLCKTSFTGASGLPVDGAVQLEQPVFDRSGSDEPGIERIIYDRLVCSPAMRVIVFVFLNPESPVLFP